MEKPASRCTIGRTGNAGDMRPAYPFVLILILLISACVKIDNSARQSKANKDRATGEMCGGIAGLQCGSEKDYCAMQIAQCREIADAAGVCAVKPQFCTRDYRPVCGCDGNTYSNACGAASQGVSIQYAGACRE